jgi:uncharacterized sulfatase
MKTKAACLALLAALPALPGAAPNPSRPNILWITCEDTGPQLGCYGDPYATTPNLDRLAAGSMIYTRAWSCAPVCAPARTAIISGLYPPSTGSEHMRSLVPLPPGFRMYPQFLREAGYYCTNNQKEDYNLEKPGQVWDDSSRRAHWTNRAPGQPFFAIFNHTVTHESQIRARPHTPVHDPGKARVPAFHPDTSEVRRDWAQYYDKITEMDRLAGENLRELEAAGLGEDTIIFFYGDHGPGIARCKRFPYNSGLAVPLIVHVPEKWRSLAPPEYQAGGRSSRLVSFVDLAPTLLSLIGTPSPPWMQGRAFLGQHVATAPRFNFGFRGRMDERIDLVRSATDGRYVYLRNYLPHLPHGQHVAYMFETPTTQVWKRLYDEGKLPPAQASFWERKAPEELYDLQTDPDETVNLAASPAHAAIKATLSQALRQHLLATHDLGFLPEEEVELRRGRDAPYVLGGDPGRYPLERVLETAEWASLPPAGATDQLVRRLADADAAVRFWAVMGLRVRGIAAVAEHRTSLLRALEDESPSVRIAAADALTNFGEPEDRERGLRVLVALADLRQANVLVAVRALNVLDGLGPKTASVLPAIRALPTTGPGIPERLNSYVPRLLKDLDAGAPQG